MGKYDINAKFNDDCKLTIADLCNDILNDVDTSEDKKLQGKETLRAKFKNFDRSGILDKLKDNLDFDMESIAKNSKLERYNMFKILKLIYYIEKDGYPKYKQVQFNNVKIQITDILAKPRLSNINTEFSKTSIYGEIFDSLFYKIKSEITDADERCARLEKINLYWNYITAKIFDYVISDEALINQDSAMAELERINYFLKNKIIFKLQDNDNFKTLYPEDVMRTFFNILACHRLLCYEYDKININYECIVNEHPSQNYVDFFKANDNCMVKWDILSEITKVLSEKDENNIAIKVLCRIPYDLDNFNLDIKHYKYAVSRAKIVASWVAKHRNTDYSHGIHVNMLIVIMQEIIANKKNCLKIANDYYGYKNKYKSMTNALNNPDTADSVVIQAWLTKLENRTAVNFGAYELLKKKREVENNIYEIKKIIYSYQNLDNLEFVNNILFHFVYRASISRELAKRKCKEFIDKIIEKLQSPAREKCRFQIFPDNLNVYDMFREFLFDKNNTENTVVKNVAEMINDFYKNDNIIARNPMGFHFNVHYSEDIIYHFVYTFSINKFSNIFKHCYFLEIESDDFVEKMNALGLEKFIIR